MSLNEPSKDPSTQSSRPDTSRKRPVSERRIQANRRNALRSTGPKTERGKRTVSGNAIKHGILAREVVITAGDGKESLEAFHDLANQLCEYYEPVGIVEEKLVETIAACWWRQARTIRAENGEIRGRLDMLAADRAQRNSDKANLDVVVSVQGLPLYRAENQADQQVSSMDRLSAAQVAQTDLRGHVAGLTHLSVLLQKAKLEIASSGYISKESGQEIFNTFYLWDYLFVRACQLAGPPHPAAPHRGRTGCELARRRRQGPHRRDLRPPEPRHRGTGDRRPARRARTARRLRAHGRHPARRQRRGRRCDRH